MIIVEMIVILHDDSLVSINIESDESWIVVGCLSFNKISNVIIVPTKEYQDSWV